MVDDRRHVTVVDLFAITPRVRASSVPIGLENVATERRSCFLDWQEHNTRVGDAKRQHHNETTPQRDSDPHLLLPTGSFGQYSSWRRCETMASDVQVVANRLDLTWPMQTGPLQQCPCSTANAAEPVRQWGTTLERPTDVVNQLKPAVEPMQLDQWGETNATEPVGPSRRARGRERDTNDESPFPECQEICAGRGRVGPRTTYWHR